jgi:hypothetical protein
MIIFVENSDKIVVKSNQNKNKFAQLKYYYYLCGVNQ